MVYPYLRKKGCDRGKTLDPDGISSLSAVITLIFIPWGLSWPWMWLLFVIQQMGGAVAKALTQHQEESIPFQALTQTFSVTLSESPIQRESRKVVRQIHSGQRLNSRDYSISTLETVWFLKTI